MKNILLIICILALAACKPGNSVYELEQVDNLDIQTEQGTQDDETYENTDSADKTAVEENEVAETNTIVAPANPSYEDYSEARYDQLVAASQPFVVFFHADWCPVCRGLEKDINAELSSFPKGTVILKADYDTEKELKEKYSIYYQSTLVIVNKSGEKQEVLVAPENEALIAAIEESLES